MERDVYFGYLKLGEQHKDTLGAANNYAVSLVNVERFEEAKSLLRKTMPVARRVLGESHDLTLTLKKVYADSLYEDDSATLNDLREAVKTLAETEQTARRVLGGAHPTATGMKNALQEAREALCARDGGVSAIQEAVEKMTPGDA